MIPEKKNEIVTSAGALKSMDFEIGDEEKPFIFDALLETLYNDPVAAFWREIGCNAQDAHTEAGMPDRPIVVTLPTVMSPIASIRDYGSGLSPEKVQSVFLRVGASDKRGTNEQTGCLGFGAKCPFAYNKTWSLMTHHRGIRYSYTALKVYEEGVGRPTLSLVNREVRAIHLRDYGVELPEDILDSDFVELDSYLTEDKIKPFEDSVSIVSFEDTGTKISLPMRSREDISVFVASSRRVFSAFRIAPVDDAGDPLDRLSLQNISDSTIEDLDDKIFKKNQNWTNIIREAFDTTVFYAKRSWLKHFLYIRMGDILYPVTFSDINPGPILSRYLAKFKSDEKVCLIVPAEMGQFRFHPSRENMPATNEMMGYIEDVLAKTLAPVKEKLIGLFKGTENIYDRAFARLYCAGLKSIFEIDLVPVEREIGFLLDRTSLEQIKLPHITVTETVVDNDYVITETKTPEYPKTFEISIRTRRLKGSGKEGFRTYLPNSPEWKNQAFLSVGPRGNIVFRNKNNLSGVLIQNCSGIAGRLANSAVDALARRNMWSKAFPYSERDHSLTFLVVTPKDNYDETELESFLAQYSLNEMSRYLLSDLRPPPRTQRNYVSKGRKAVYYLLPKNQWGRTDVAQDCWAEAPEDLEELPIPDTGAFYLPIEKFRTTYGNLPDNMNNFNELTLGLSDLGFYTPGIEIKTPLVLGVKERAIPAIEKAGVLSASEYYKELIEEAPEEARRNVRKMSFVIGYVLELEELVGSILLGEHSHLNSRSAGSVVDNILLTRMTYFEPKIIYDVFPEEDHLFRLILNCKNLRRILHGSYSDRLEEERKNRNPDAIIKLGHYATPEFDFITRAAYLALFIDNPLISNFYPSYYTHWLGPDIFRRKQLGKKWFVRQGKRRWREETDELKQLLISLLLGVSLDDIVRYETIKRKK